MCVNAQVAHVHIQSKSVHALKTFRVTSVHCIKDLHVTAQQQTTTNAHMHAQTHNTHHTQPPGQLHL